MRELIAVSERHLLGWLLILLRFCIEGSTNRSQTSDFLKGAARVIQGRCACAKKDSERKRERDRQRGIYIYVYIDREIKR